MSHPLFPKSVKCQRPKFKEHRGRTWDVCNIIDTQGGKHEGHFDTTWGHYFYFQHDGEWRKASVDLMVCYTVDFRNAHFQI